MNKIIDFLYNNFCHRKDAYCLMTCHPWQKDEHGNVRHNYYKRKYEPLTKDLIKQHLSGEITLGVFPTDLNSQTVKFICFDVDTPDQVYLQKAIFWASQVSNNVIIECSGGAEHRRHVWGLLDTPISLKEAREFLRHKDGTGMDFFPNQDVVINDFYYELPIKLPLGLHRKSLQWSYFINE